MIKNIATINIVTEGKSDAELLGRLLPSINGHLFHFEPAGGKNAAITVASTLLHTVHETVLMVIDADKERDNVEVEFIRELVGKDSFQFKLVLMIPEVEILFFTDRVALSHALEMEIDETIWEIGLSAPKAALDALLKNLEKLTGKKRTALQLLNSEPLLNAMRNHPKIKEIKEFALAAHA